MIKKMIGAVGRFFAGLFHRSERGLTLGEKAVQRGINYVELKAETKDQVK